MCGINVDCPIVYPVGLLADTTHRFTGRPNQSNLPLIAAGQTVETIQSALFASGTSHSRLGLDFKTEAPEKCQQSPSYRFVFDFCMNFTSSRLLQFDRFA